MRTPKQIAASRANGARSRGPVTPEGKAKAARNNRRHGLLAKAVVIEGESEALFNELVDNLNESLKPESEIDHLLVGKMAAAHWRQIRLWEMERAGEPTPHDHEMRLDRQFFRTLDRYVRLRNFPAIRTRQLSDSERSSQSLEPNTNPPEPAANPPIG